MMFVLRDIDKRLIDRLKVAAKADGLTPQSLARKAIEAMVETIETENGHTSRLR